jgi:hypothetical protein
MKKQLQFVQDPTIYYELSNPVFIHHIEKIKDLNKVIEEYEIYLN